MTEVLIWVINRIQDEGPITIDTYMAECLFQQGRGYYDTRNPLGAKGDFITAPEISQMFGECLGLALAHSWRDRNSPDPFLLMEAGPGRGTLMLDMLRATANISGFRDAMQLLLLEESSKLKKIQKEALQGHRAGWTNSVDGLPGDAPLFLIANEFLDALPVRQFLRHGKGWKERKVDVSNGSLKFVLRKPSARRALPGDRASGTPDGQMFELGTDATRFIRKISQRIARCGGVAILIDYGDWCSCGDTLQAVRNHRPVPVLAHPGEADLTAHVDFGAIAAEATDVLGIRVTGMTSQGALLERLGINERAERLAQGLEGRALWIHATAHRRLTHPTEMGTLFKAIAIYRDGEPPPPGFDP